MAKEIEPRLKSISNYLKLGKKEKFVIPEYQRAYSWQVEQCDKLWQDIEAFIEEFSGKETDPDPYFFGTIIVDCSTPNAFSLIDGQQRTITFLLLLKALLLRINEKLPKIRNDNDSKSLNEGLKARRNTIMRILYKAEAEDIPSMLNEHSEKLVSDKIKNILILENNSINELYHKEIKNIIEAVDFEEAEKKVCRVPYKRKDNKYTNYFKNFKFFYGKLEKDASQLNEFAKIFLEKCQVIEIRSWQIEQAITMFNSLNSTGMPLTDADIISAQLYANAGNKNGDFNEKWRHIKQLADQLNKRNITDINGILQQFMYINRALNKEYDVTKKPDGSISVDVTTPGVRRYYTEKTEIKKGLLSEPLVNKPLELCNKLEKIANLWDIVKDYPIVKLLLKFNENIKLFLAGYLYRFEPKEEPTEISKESISEICECLIRLFTILEVDEIGYSSTKFKTFLFGEMVKLVDKNIKIDEIKKDFNEHIQKYWGQSKEDLEEYISEYSKNTLVYLNEYLYAKQKKQEFVLSDNVNIEHIMPSSGRNIQTIQEEAGINDEKEFQRVVNQLGNKILLEEDINKSIGNAWFKTKKEGDIKDKSGYKGSNYPIAKDLANCLKDVWTKDDIADATKKATGRILNFILDKQDE